ncbi:MAG TPA: DNA repair exonuclease [Acidobacteriota bacterium]|nr:DNA repair exonuclease [Acidobacteriota bacterium]
MKPIRFIHTSDVHLDTSFSGSGFPSRLGDRKREAIRGTFRRIVEDVLSQDVQLMLIAGDLFEHDRITPDTVEFLKRQFERLGSIPVFISPGNHDPFIQGSPYRDEDWSANVSIFREESFQTIELPEIGIRVAGFGYTHNQLEEHPFSKLPTMPGDLTNIVLAHASDISRVPSGKLRHGPFAVEEIAGKNIGYVALGHYHQQRAVTNELDEAQVWYSGIPEGRGWEEEGRCGYLLGEIVDGKIRVEGRPCNQFPLQTISLNCDGFSSREQIVEAILQHRGSSFDATTILRVRLEGTLDVKLDLSFNELEARLAGEVLHIEWQDETSTSIDYDSLAHERTLRGRFAKILNERISSASGAEREIMERARLYGTQALLGRDVRLK